MAHYRPRQGQRLTALATACRVADVTLNTGRRGVGFPPLCELNTINLAPAMGHPVFSVTTDTVAVAGAFACVAEADSPTRDIGPRRPHNEEAVWIVTRRSH